MTASSEGETTVAPPQLDLTPAERVALAERHRQAGHLSAAAELCRQVLSTLPLHAEALHLLGIVTHQLGERAPAIDLVRRAIAVDGGVALYHCNLGELCRQAGHLEEALAAGERALTLRPDYAEAANNLGIAHYDLGNFAQAIECYLRAIALAPAYAQAHNNLGNARRAQNELEAAVEHYQQALAITPDYADAYNNLGTALRELKRLPEAEAAYRRALSLNPDDPVTLNNLALIARDDERLDEAQALLMQSAAFDPDNHQTFARLASILLSQHKPAEARRAVERALALRPDDPDALITLGDVLVEEGRADKALAYFRRAAEVSPDDGGAYSSMGGALKELGYLEEARAAYRKSLVLHPRAVGTYLAMADLRTFTPEDPHLATLETMLADAASLPETERILLHFAAGKAYDDLGRHRDAFEHWMHGNALKRRRIEYDPADFAQFVEQIRTVFTPELMRDKANAGDPSAVPVFVVGMPRSGTTLVEQILASHPDVFGAGELSYIHKLTRGARAPDGSELYYPGFVPSMAADELRHFGETYLRLVRALAPDTLRVTDKMPSNFYYLGIMHLALPNARIVHMVRNPVDTCLSCFSNLFAREQHFTYDLGELGRYYRLYESLMEHWHRVLPPGVMLDMRYEDVVDDIETHARRIVAHVGLAWNDACLAFHKNKRQIRTASVVQVRRPLYRNSVGRWLPYKEFLRPLLEGLQIEPPAP